MATVTDISGTENLIVDPPQAIEPASRLYRLTLEQYHALARSGVLASDDRVELLDGILVRKMTKNSAHVLVTRLLTSLLQSLIAGRWFIANQDPITLANSEPEPDVMVVRGEVRDYAARHPGPADVPLLIEVADTSLAQDRGLKKQLYARAGIAVYWVVNLAERTIEVYREPVAEAADYRTLTIYRAGDALPVDLDGQTLGTFDPGAIFG